MSKIISPKQNNKKSTLRLEMKAKSNEDVAVKGGGSRHKRVMSNRNNAVNKASPKDPRNKIVNVKSRMSARKEVQKAKPSTLKGCARKPVKSKEMVVPVEAPPNIPLPEPPLTSLLKKKSSDMHNNKVLKKVPSIVANNNNNINNINNINNVHNNNNNLEEEKSDQTVSKFGNFPLDDKSWVSPDECKMFTKNIAKNRYTNIPCLDKTRLVLPDEEKFYIHANRVRACTSFDRFVCTQAPLPETINDFWKVVQHLETTFIVMLCGFVEGGLSKCAKYFPDAGTSMETDNFIITTESTNEWNCDGEPSPDKVLQSKLKYNNKVTGKEGRITHYQWLNWPDHGSPELVETTLKILAAVRRAGSPIVVHCSAGVGRTGTVILVESMIQALCNPKTCSVNDCFSNLRKDRAKMVQTFPQYVYAVRCVIEYFVSKGCSKNEDSFNLFKEQCSKFLLKKKRVRSSTGKKKGSFSAEDADQNGNAEKVTAEIKKEDPKEDRIQDENAMLRTAEPGFFVENENELNVEKTQGGDFDPPQNQDAPKQDD